MDHRDKRELHNISAKNNDKSQVLAEFVADFFAKIMPEVEKEAAQAYLQTQDLWILYTDGASITLGSGLELVLEVQHAK